MSKVIFNIFADNALFMNLAIKTQCQPGELSLHYFPDQEVKISILTEVQNKDIIILTDFANPNLKLAPILFLINGLHDMHARSVGLIAPYLPYMRQDTAFSRGELVTSKYFATIVSAKLQWLITIDPHLHRYNTLKDIYSIPTKTLHATQLVADWIKSHVSNAVLIGPDQESAQWLARIAADINLPHVILKKNRVADNKVIIDYTELSKYRNHNPVIIDDIIATGNTIKTILHHLQHEKFPPAVCVTMHALFCDNSYAEISALCKDVISCNTVSHRSNKLDISDLIASELNRGSINF